MAVAYVAAVLLDNQGATAAGIAMAMPWVARHLSEAAATEAKRQQKGGVL